MWYFGSITSNCDSFRVERVLSIKTEKSKSTLSGFIDGLSGKSTNIQTFLAGISLCPYSTSMETGAVDMVAWLSTAAVTTF